jgi:Arc/MetJ family transcription regulator
MRITLNIDDEALASAMRVSPGKTKTDVINEALRDYARRRRRLQEFLEFEGKMRWEGDLDQLRNRSRSRR